MHTIKLAGITNVAIDTRSCPRYALVRRIRICHTTLAVLLANRCRRRIRLLVLMLVLMLVLVGACLLDCNLRTGDNVSFGC